MHGWGIVSGDKLKCSSISVGIGVFSSEMDFIDEAIEEMALPSRVTISKLSSYGNSFRINALRNLAISKASTSHIFIADADILPACTEWVKVWPLQITFATHFCLCRPIFYKTHPKRSLFLYSTFLSNQFPANPGSPAFNRRRMRMWRVNWVEWINTCEWIRISWYGVFVLEGVDLLVRKIPMFLFHWMWLIGCRCICQEIGISSLLRTIQFHCIAGTILSKSRNFDVLNWEAGSSSWAKQICLSLMKNLWIMGTIRSSGFHCFAILGTDSLFCRILGRFICVILRLCLDTGL